MPLSKLRAPVKLDAVLPWSPTKSANSPNTRARATKDIAALIKSIQAETNEAVVVMEEGTKEVEVGARWPIKPAKRWKRFPAWYANRPNSSRKFRSPPSSRCAARKA